MRDSFQRVHFALKIRQQTGPEHLDRNILGGVGNRRAPGFIDASEATSMTNISNNLVGFDSVASANEALAILELARYVCASSPPL
jgi:hypothetical protein